MNALELSSFSVAFSDRTVLHDVTLMLPRTGATVLVGPSGGGKSTLLRTLSGANDGHASMVVRGVIAIDGDVYADLGSVPLERRPGLVRQNVRFLIDTVRENLVTALPNRASLRRGEQDEIIALHLEAMNLTELKGQLTTSVAELPIVTQRLIALARITLSNPAILLVDEVTASLAEAEAGLVLEHLREQATRRAVLFVTHHQGHARAVGGTTCLLNGGHIVASAPTEEFFGHPTQPSARQFVSTGCCIPEQTSDLDADFDPDADPQAAPDSVQPEDPPPLSLLPHAESAARGPRHFYWVIRGRLGGLPRPGIFQDVGHDLDGLERVKVTTLVTLEEWESVPSTELEQRPMELLHFPIDDMKAPTVEAAEEMCLQLDARIRNRGVVALHCRAGNGRTGTMLAAMLIYQNTPACDALERVRSVNPKAVESDAQVRFLETFERYLKTRRQSQPSDTAANIAPTPAKP